MRIDRAALAMAFGMAVAGAGRAADDLPVNVPSDEPTRIERDLFESPVRLAADDGIIDRGDAWGHAGPWVEDVNGDGVRDLIVGDFSGLFAVYKNVGSNREPRYAKAVTLQAGGVDAKVPIY
jgi:hypothetical protein